MASACQCSLIATLKRPETWVSISFFAQACNMVGAGGKVIVVGMVPSGQEVSLDGHALMREKALLGCLYGSTRPLVDMSRIVDLYVAGRLKNGEVGRSVIKFRSQALALRAGACSG
jgi:Zn-dependent alcohol dehydrogenase